MRIRCSQDPTAQTISTFGGLMYSYIPQEEQKPLFKIEGMNVCRCFEAENGDWWQTGREVLYYLDLETNEPLY